jgi:hypothetical protein
VILQLLTIMTGEALVSSGTAAQLLQVIKPNLVALQTEWCVPCTAHWPANGFRRLLHVAQLGVSELCFVLS